MPDACSLNRFHSLSRNGDTETHPFDPRLQSNLRRFNAKVRYEAPKKLPFDPKVFLSKVNGGRSISEYHNNQIVLRAGQACGFCFSVHTAANESCHDAKRTGRTHSIHT